MDANFSLKNNVIDVLMIFSSSILMSLANSIAFNNVIYSIGIVTFKYYNFTHRNFSSNKGYRWCISNHLWIEIIINRKYINKYSW